MSGAVPVEAILPLTGAVNAAILAVAIWRRPSAGGGVLYYAAALLMIVASVIFIIVADHAGIASLSAAERLLTLAAGPVFLLFVAALLRRSLDWRVAVAPAIFVGAFYVLGDGLPFWTIVVAQAGYTCVALAIALRQPSDGLRSSERRKQLALVVTGVALLVHTAQAIRFLAPDVASLQNLVPNVAGVGVLALAVLAFLRARLPVVDLLAPVQGEQDGAAVAELISRLDRALGEGGLARKTDLKASDAAAAVGVSARELAKALGEARGASFSEYILRKRVELALRLLRDPAERRTSMEAIGLLAGFGSRSAFYSAFTKQVGETPSAFRKRNGEDSCPDS